MTAFPHAHLRAAGAALILDVTGPLLPRVLHWGADLGALTDDDLATLAAAGVPPVPHSALDEPWPLTLLPSEIDGWSGTPGLAGHREGGDPFPRFTLTGPVEVTESGMVAHAADADAGLAVRVEVVMEPAGVVRVRYELRNTGEGTYDLSGMRALLPLPQQAGEVLDLTGRAFRERAPQRGPLSLGTRTRASRRGRTGHDATLLMVAGTAGFGFRHGEVWGAHLAWSGDHEHLAERLPEGAGGHAGVLGCGELLRPGEVRLAPGQRYTTPWALFAWSGSGLDGLTARLHRYVRARPAHPRSPRPVVLNTWEAVYFDLHLDSLRALADIAASIGVERFVLDDGWFRHRRSDRAGLGDWYVDGGIWPDGLHPLFDHVRRLGMQVGLWVEPEMINPDSDLARAHPEWVLTPSAGLWRAQRVLDVAHPDAFAYLLERLDALVTEYRPDYLKWDHNRDLHAAVHRGAPGVHAQTLAAYGLLDELRARHPGLEIESCASGGARVDLGILERTDRVWASDTNDALERQMIQRWTALLLPPELIGAHVGPTVAHTTGRGIGLPFRCATALFGHAGIEWNIAGCSPEELEQLRAWTALYRELRGLLHSGDVVRADLADPGAWLHGVVAPDRSEALFAYVRLTTSPQAVPGRVRFPGLDARRSYAVRERDASGVPPASHIAPPSWLEAGKLTVPGAVLGEVGLTMPILDPASALLLHLTS